MSRVFTSAIGAAVYVFSHDHCPPHLSVRHRGEEWIARIRFSYLNNEIDLWSIEPLKNRPSQSSINRLLDEVQAHLADCRRAWWNIQRTVCLTNQWVMRNFDGTFRSSRSETSGAEHIVEASFDPDEGRLTLEFSDGRIEERVRI